MIYAIAFTLFAVTSARLSEVWTEAQEKEAGIVYDNHFRPLPQDYIKDEDLPDEFTWCDKDGVNYCTMSRNQHIPQYCGACWAHGAVSALADRVKIARGAKGIDINLSVQHILNCANVGSCHGGSVTGVYQWLHGVSKSGTGISYETSNPYLACSSESREGFCKNVDTTCKVGGVARTCSTFSDNGGFCQELSEYPNVTIDEYGTLRGLITGHQGMQKEIFARGPISCGIDASPILKYQTGIATGKGAGTDHVVSVVGWGKEGDQSYWIVRNSWGEYWGEMGYIKVAFGALSLESQCTWATVKDYTAPEKNNQFHCFEDGSNCKAN